MNEIRARLRRFTWTMSWHRRLLAAGLAAGATAFAIEAASPDLPDGHDAVVARHDLSGGIALSEKDLTTVVMPKDVVPDGVLDVDSAVGKVLTSPVRAGEPLTDRRILSKSTLTGWGKDLVATPVRVSDADSVTYLQHGDVINLLASPTEPGGQTETIAAGVPVVALPDADSDAIGADGALLMVAATPRQAENLASAAVHARVSFTLVNADKT